MMPRFVRLGVVLGISAVLFLGVAFRMSQRSAWLLKSPDKVNEIWVAVDTPLASDLRATLANPEAYGREYHNPFDEQITFQCISPGSFEAYREPPVFSLYALSAQRELAVLGPDKNKPVRAWILKRRDGLRVLMYAWLQSKSGEVRLFGTSSAHQNILDRFEMGMNTLTQKEPWCLVRLFTIIPATDENATQTRQSLDAIARAIYETGRSGK
jgi:hypothetical protein